MKTLYILGNGFDVYHGLKTRYADFHKFVSEHHADLETSLENYFNFQVDKNYLWKNFESDLCKFNHKSFFDDLNHLDIMDDSFKPSQCFSREDDIAQQSDELVQNLKAAFLSWIEAVEYPDKDQIHSLLLPFEPESLFMSFNYTDTLEELYQVPKNNILYLHNNANDFSGDLIFGHGETEEKNPKEDDLDENGDSRRTMFTDAEDAARSPFYALQKDTEAVLATHADFFERVSNIEQVIVLGHSLGKVDWPYFQKIATIAPTAVCRISYYPIEAKRQMELEAKKMFGSRKPQFKMIEISEL
jgi:hypothetical protein